ncbi:MAG: YigZ family protein [Chloroflexota bacterium]
MISKNKSQLLIPAKQVRSEIRVANSRFITSAAPAFTVEEAKIFLSKIKQEFVDASHNVPIFIIGHSSTVTAHSSDDGEPTGTAGRPALAVLKGSGLGDIAVVITRYFGGTKLGTGGLVRAYSDSVRSVLEILPLAEKVSTHTLSINMPYSFYERVLSLIDTFDGIHKNKDFGSDVNIVCQLAVHKFKPFQKSLQELSHGTLKAVITSTNSATIVPFQS